MFCFHKQAQILNLRRMPLEKDICLEMRGSQSPHIVRSK